MKFFLPFSAFVPLVLSALCLLSLSVGAGSMFSPCMSHDGMARGYCRKMVVHNPLGPRAQVLLFVEVL